MIDLSGFIGFYNFYDIYRDILTSLGLNDSASWMFCLAAAITFSFVVINVMILSTAFYTWFERRAIGRFHARRGPNRHGPFGILQPFADVIKLILMEDTVPDEADKAVFTLAPIALLAPTLLIVAVIPLSDDSFLGSLNIGVLFIVGVTSVNSIAIFMAGWGSRNKYAILGSMRGAAMLISYEIPMALGITGVLLVSGSLALTEIVKTQSLCLGLFNIFLIAVEYIVLTNGDETLTKSDMLIMGVVNWIVGIIIIAIMINVFGRKKLSRPEPVPSPLANMRTGGQ